jgi:microcystin-dependent protein
MKTVLIILFIAMILYIVNNCYKNIKEEFIQSTIPRNIEIIRKFAGMIVSIKTDNARLDGGLNALGSVNINGPTMDILPIGSILPYAGFIDNTTKPPPGWLLCDGKEIDISGNPQLKPLSDLLLDTFGKSNGRNKLPDFRGRVLLGGSVGQSDGKENVKLEVGHLPSHTHVINEDQNHTHAMTVNHANSHCNGSGVYTNTRYHSSPPTSTDPDHSHALGSTGGDKVHNNMMPFVALNYIIRAI